MKIAWKILLLALLATLINGTFCFADDDDDNAPPLPRGVYNLGEEPPKPKPKPKVIIKEKVVLKMVCPSGSTWNSEVQKCQDEDGNDVVVVPKKKAQVKQRVVDDEETPVASPQRTAQIPNDKYIYPRTKVRVRPGQCMMNGESITCDITFINAENDTYINLENVAMRDNLSNSYKPAAVNCIGWSYGCGLPSGGSKPL